MVIVKCLNCQNKMKIKTGEGLVNLSCPVCTGNQIAFSADVIRVSAVDGKEEKVSRGKKVNSFYSKTKGGKRYYLWRVLTADKQSAEVENEASEEVENEAPVKPKRKKGN